MEFRTTNSFFTYKYVHKFTCQVQYPKLLIVYTNGNKKLTKIIRDGCVYKGVGLNTAIIY